MALLKRIWLFYYEGFKGMTLGKTLWTIILIKLAIMFLILRPFFFKRELRNFPTEREKGEYVIDQLTKPKTHIWQLSNNQKKNKYDISFIIKAL